MARSILRLAPMFLALTACIDPVDTRPAGLPLSDETPTRLAQAPAVALPPMKVFSRVLPLAPTRSNSDIAQDFLDLSFKLESGRALPVFTRFEAPIEVVVSGKPAPGMITDLRAVMRRLRQEAGIDINFGKASLNGSAKGQALVTVQAVSSAEIRRYLPQAACFVVPGITSLSQYHEARRAGLTDWARLGKREKIAIFVPNDVAPQEARDCLHEELAQALGPLNDLYRLPDSTFNDDNMHTVLTGFDMLVLKATYAPELRSGMSREEVARVLPGLLARLNPQGDGELNRRLPETTPEWINDITAALGPGRSEGARVAAAQNALRVAQSEGWQDHRLGFSHFVLARMLQRKDRAEAFKHMTAAYTIFRRRPETATHAAHAAAQLAAHALREGKGDLALSLLNGQDDVARQSENAALLASIQMLRAEALEMTGRDSDAQTVRLDSLGWARYGFGPDWAVRAKLDEIAALRPDAIRG
ncbi:DUF2927 domain-containing protein [Pseudooceanicola sp. C21-150M6]|uniref:DUF2927 domain-containing protein n=1 Tax=Pseudooceanicola sp. C21-150M6 TaxID=3434355 RepID=UPI003D7F7F05